MFFRFALVLSLVAFSIRWTPAYASAEGGSVQEGGLELYLVEERAPTETRNELGLSYGMEFASSYYSVRNLKLTYLRPIGGGRVRDVLRVGASISRFFSSDSALNQAIVQNLSGSRILRITAERPSVSAQGLVDVTPFRGHLGLFTRQPLELDLRLRAGSGIVTYENAKSRFVMSWSFRPTLRVSSNLAVEVAGGQDVESPFQADDKVARWLGEAGLTFFF